MKKLSEQITVEEGIVSADIATADITSPYVDVRTVGARHIMSKLFTSTVVAATKIVTIELVQATASAGTGVKSLKAAVTATAPTGGAKLNATIEANVNEMDHAGGFYFVAVKVGSDNATAVIASAQLYFSGSRYSP